MKQLTLAIKFTADDESREQFKQILTGLFNTISAEQNFVNATLSQDIQNPNEFLVYETWNDTIEHFIKVQMKEPYAVAFEKTLDALNIKREPAAYTPFGSFGTHAVN